MDPKELNILGDPSNGSSYPDVNVDDIKRMAIFPPIGIARVGDSDIDCFLAPEVHGRTSPPEGLKVGSEVRCPMFPRPPTYPITRSPYDLQFKFRDAQQKLRRQVLPSINVKG